MVPPWEPPLRKVDLDSMETSLTYSMRCVSIEMEDDSIYLDLNGAILVCDTALAGCHFRAQR